MNKNLIIIPTYNEALNIKNLVAKIYKFQKKIDILFIDDNSPDKTSDIVKKMQIRKKNIFLINRKKKLGIGSAHKTGLKWGFKKKYERIVTMDADGTHNPKYIRKLLYHSRNNHLVITNRFLTTGSLDSWPWIRVFITKTRHTLVKLLLGMPYDSSGAFRCYNLNYVNIKDILTAEDNGYSFFWESLFIFYKRKYLIKEIPGTLHNRNLGTSKITSKDIIHAVYYLFKIYLTKKNI